MQFTSPRFSSTLLQQLVLISLSTHEVLRTQSASPHLSSALAIYLFCLGFCYLATCCSEGRVGGKGELHYVTSEGRLACTLKEEKKAFHKPNKGGLKWRRRWIWNLRLRLLTPPFCISSCLLCAWRFCWSMNKGQGRVEVVGMKARATQQSGDLGSRIGKGNLPQKQEA